MNPYAMLGSRIGTSEANSLSVRLAAWHDSMVAHERLLRTEHTGDICHDECPHVEARTLWTEALETFGTRAEELVFLRSRAKFAGQPAARTDRRAVAGSQARPSSGASRSSRSTTAEV
jgi:hypothetical protein